MSCPLCEKDFTKDRYCDGCPYSRAAASVLMREQESYIRGQVWKITNGVGLPAAIEFDDLVQAAMLATYKCYAKNNFDVSKVQKAYLILSVRGAVLATLNKARYGTTNPREHRSFVTIPFSRLEPEEYSDVLDYIQDPA